MKVIFLDIDGVLNYRGCKHKLPNSNFYFVDDAKIKLLKTIIDETRAKIVLSSTWRYDWINSDLGLHTDGSFELLRNKLLEHGISLLSKTPKLKSAYRGEEIDAWLKNWKGEPVEAFIILDDDNDMKPHGSRLIQTSFEKGLETKHVIKAIKMLNE